LRMNSILNLHVAKLLVVSRGMEYSSLVDMMTLGGDAKTGGEREERRG
jgi:hypothetical protein